MSDALNILVLTTMFPHRPGDKDGNFIHDQVCELAAMDARVTVLVCKPRLPRALGLLANPLKRDVDPAVYAGSKFQVKTANYFSLPRYALGTKAARFTCSGVMPSVRSICSAQRTQLIHAHGITLGHVAIEASSELGIPSIVTMHGIDTTPRITSTAAKRRQIGSMLAAVGRVVLVGSPLTEYYSQFVSNTKNFIVVGNGFRIYPGLQPSALIPRVEQTRVVAVSHLFPEKGFDVLIRGLALLRARGYPSVEAVLVGEGPERPMLELLARELNLADRVHFTGALAHPEAESEVMAGDIFCLPSWREAFGIMYAEAMALGKLVIGCRGQGPSDFITHRDTGYLLEPQSPESVADALAWAISNPEAARDAAFRGREYAHRRLTWRNNAETMHHLYNELITSFPARQADGESACHRTSNA
ncbi:MAG TPA: glycosyltransferase [Clostridia bacterium]|nr:glycosyltransferase [Clostridia bacterium]